MSLFLALSLICLAGSVYYVGELVTQPARERERSVRRATNYGRHRVAAVGL